MLTATRRPCATCGDRAYLMQPENEVRCLGRCAQTQPNPAAGPTTQAASSHQKQEQKQ